MNLFKCTLPSDEVIESYMQQIQDFAVTEMTEIAVNCDLCTASDIQRWFKTTKKSKFALFSGKKRESRDELAEDIPLLFGSGLEDIINNEKFSDHIVIDILGKANKMSNIQPRVPAVVVRCADYILQNGT